MFASGTAHARGKANNRPSSRTEPGGARRSTESLRTPHHRSLPGNSHTGKTVDTDFERIGNSNPEPGCAFAVKGQYGGAYEDGLVSSSPLSEAAG
jgi:hypothetical protein